jgi:hypothetical protein
MVAIVGIVCVSLPLLAVVHYIIKRSVPAGIKEIDPLYYVLLWYFLGSKVIHQRYKGTNFCVQFYRYSHYYITRDADMDVVLSSRTYSFSPITFVCRLKQYENILVQNKGTLNDNVHEYVCSVCVSTPEIIPIVYKLVFYYITHFTPDIWHHHSAIWNEAVYCSNYEVEKMWHRKLMEPLVLEACTVPAGSDVTIDLSDRSLPTDTVRDIEEFLLDLMTTNYWVQMHTIVTDFNASIAGDQFEWQKIIII